MTYSFVQLVFFFLVYCFVGWIIECTYVSVCTKKLTNRGFMRGPVIPIYGCGAMMLLLSSTPFLKWPVAVFFAGMIGCSVLEYFTGAAMEAIFKVRYWDYSGKKFNLNGHICLFTSVCWGFCSLGVNYFLHKPVRYVSETIPYPVLKWLTVALSVIFIIDFTLAFKAAIDLRNIIIKMEKAKEDMRLMAKRLDVMIAYVNEDMEDRRKQISAAVDNWSDGIEDKLGQISENFDALADSIENNLTKVMKAIEEMPQSFAENMKAEFYELKGKFATGQEQRTSKDGLAKPNLRAVLKGNPTLVSPKFKDSLDAVKSMFNLKNKKGE